MAQLGTTAVVPLARCARCGRGVRGRVCFACGSTAVIPPSSGREVDAVHVSRIASQDDLPHLLTGMPGLDRILGGDRPGLAECAVVSLAGPPGVGKSTLVAALAALLAERRYGVLYCAAEEDPGAVKHHLGKSGVRLDTAEERLPLWVPRCSTWQHAVSFIRAKDPEVVVIDSINRFATADEHAYRAGSVEQILAVARHARAWAHDPVAPRCFILVCHVTKDGDMAGPKALEHDVDVCLRLGVDDRGRRFLLATKNRHGPSHRVLWLDMTADGLEEHADPSLEALAHTDPEPGVVFLPDASLAEPQIVRVEASVQDPAGDLGDGEEGRPGRPKGALHCVGVDPARVKHVLRLIRAMDGLSCLAGQDIAVEVGTVLGEPCRDAGLDLALAVALLGATLHRTVPWPAVAFGRLSVRGHVEPVDRDHLRLEAARSLGLRAALVPKGSRTLVRPGRLLVSRVSQLDAIERWFAPAAGGKKALAGPRDS